MSKRAVVVVQKGEVMDLFAHLTNIDSNRIEQSLKEHCLNVAEYATESIGSLGVYYTVYLAGVLHDLGKAKLEFVEYIEKAYRGERVERGSVNHTFAGVIWLFEKYHTTSSSKWERLACEIIGYAVGSHHGIFDCVDLDGKNGFLHRLKKDKKELFYEETLHNYFENVVSEDFLDKIFQKAVYETRSFFEKAIKVFGQNSKQLLLGAPIKGKTVMGFDPAYRTGCKIAVIDETGKVLYTTVIFPTAPQNKVEESKKTVLEIIAKYNVSLISLGNGTASRESEAVVVDIIKECPTKVEYIIVNEAGASVYSASKLATEEFPNFDVGQRSAASMARRLQDPLAELVKIEPKAIGVGQYQHDMNQKNLDETLGNVVEDCVNNVGVDLNTASAPLLEYVSGINKTLAKNIVAYREENGQFASRKELLKVAKLGPKAFEQCAGFLRIRDGKEPLDYTSVHPESYVAAKALLKKYGFATKDIISGDVKLSKEIRDFEKVSEEIETDVITLKDMIAEMEKPGRDPRDEMPKPVLKSDVLDFDDLKEGMELNGTVRNVIDFGAFVDIGVHQDGLVHISEMSDKFIKHPLDAVAVGDVVKVRVLSVDKNRKRIQLTMKL